MFPEMLEAVRNGDLGEFLSHIGVDHEELERAATALENETDAKPHEAFVIGFTVAIREVEKIAVIERVPEGRAMKRRPGMDRRRRRRNG